VDNCGSVANCFNGARGAVRHYDRRLGAVDDVSLAGPTVTKYYYLGNQRVAMRQGGVLMVLHGDHLGSASLATSASGAKVRPFQELKRANNVVHLRHSLAYREG
jgi:hypothetical protein